MAAFIVTEGYVPFDAGAATECKTYWKKFAVENARAGPALVVVHGGPSFGHRYLDSLRELARRDSGIGSVVFYDQLGCGRSSRVPEKAGDASFWNLSLLRRELANLVGHLSSDGGGGEGGIAPEAHGAFYLLGHSVGALLASLLAAMDRPAGLRKLVLSNGLASLKLINESNLDALSRYPAAVRDSIIECEEYRLGRRTECNVSEHDYQVALNEYRKDHALRIPPPFPEELMESLQSIPMVKDAFLTFIGGDVEMIFGGSLASEDASPVLHQISVPTLVLNGEHDKATPMAVQPFCDLIPNVTRVILANTSHFPFYEDPNGYLEAVAEYLRS